LTRHACLGVKEEIIVDKIPEEAKTPPNIPANLVNSEITFSLYSRISTPRPEKSYLKIV
jgi:hypothetical protein